MALRVALAVWCVLLVTACDAATTVVTTLRGAVNTPTPEATAIPELSTEVVREIFAANDMAVLPLESSPSPLGDPTCSGEEFWFGPNRGDFFGNHAYVFHCSTISARDKLAEHYRAKNRRVVTRDGLLVAMQGGFTGPFALDNIERAIIVR